MFKCVVGTAAGTMLARLSCDSVVCSYLLSGHKCSVGIVQPACKGSANLVWFGRQVYQQRYLTFLMAYLEASARNTNSSSWTNICMSQLPVCAMYLFKLLKSVKSQYNQSVCIEPNPSQQNRDVGVLDATPGIVFRCRAHTGMVRDFRQTPALL